MHGSDAQAQLVVGMHCNQESFLVVSFVTGIVAPEEFKALPLTGGAFLLLKVKPFAASVAKRLTFLIMYLLVSFGNKITRGAACQAFALVRSSS